MKWRRGKLVSVNGAGGNSFVGSDQSIELAVRTAFNAMPLKQKRPK